MRTRAALLTTALTVTLAGALLVPATSTAYADTWRHRDARADVQVFDSYKDSTESEPRVDPSVKQSDITTLTVRYSHDLLQVATTIRAFDAFEESWRATVLTSRGERYTLVYSAPGGTYAALFLDDRNTGCRGLRIGHTESGMLAKVPRACLGSPYRIRIGVQTTIYTDSTDPRVDTRSNRDDALRTGRLTEGEPRLGPWIAGD